MPKNCLEYISWKIIFISTQKPCPEVAKIKIDEENEQK